MYTVKFVKLSPDAIAPARAHSDDAGFDLYAAEELTLKAHAYGTVGTGISIALPSGTEAQVRPRSGLAAKNGVTVLNGPGTIDCGYRGEVRVILINHSDVDFEIKKGMRIAQMMVKPVYDTEYVEVDSLDYSARGAGGFGSSGV